MLPVRIRPRPEVLWGKAARHCGQLLRSDRREFQFLHFQASLAEIELHLLAEPGFRRGFEAMESRIAISGLTPDLPFVGSIKKLRFGLAAFYAKR